MIRSNIEVCVISAKCKKSAMAKAVYGHSKPKSAMAMAIVAIPVAPPLIVLRVFTFLCFITTAKRYCDPSCLLVRSLVCLLMMFVSVFVNMC